MPPLSDQSNSRRLEFEQFKSVRRTRPLRSDEADRYRLLWLLCGIDRVKDHAGHFSGAELAKELGLDGRQIGSRLRGLVVDGYIKSVLGVPGVWSVCDVA